MAKHFPTLVRPSLIQCPAQICSVHMAIGEELSRSRAVLKTGVNRPWQHPSQLQLKKLDRRTPEPEKNRLLVVDRGTQLFETSFRGCPAGTVVHAWALSRERKVPKTLRDSKSEPHRPGWPPYRPPVPQPWPARRDLSRSRPAGAPMRGPPPVAPELCASPRRCASSLSSRAPPPMSG